MNSIIACCRTRFASALDKTENTLKLERGTEGSGKILHLIEIIRLFLLGLKIASATIIDIFGIETVQLLIDLNILYSSQSWSPIPVAPECISETDASLRPSAGYSWIVSLVQLCPVNVISSSGELRTIIIMTDFAQVTKLLT